MKILDNVKRALGIADTSKARKGLYVSRPVMNGQEWADWATKWKVPEPLAAADLHVTVLYSTVNVQMPQDDCPMTIATQESWSPGCFCLMGPDDESLVFAFSAYNLADRHWAFINNGAVSTYPTYRPHMTITNAVGDFELPDDALADCPEFIILGGEVYADIKADDPTDADSDGDDDSTEDDATTIIVIELAAAKQARAMLAQPDVLKSMTAVDRIALADVAAQRTVTKAVYKRLAKTSWAPAEIRKSAAVTKGRLVEKDVTLTMTAKASELVAKSGLAEVMKTDDEQRLVYSIDNIYSIGGELVEDLGGDTFSTMAMEQFMASVLKKHGNGKFEHEDEDGGTVVQGIVLSQALQKALGIDLGFECIVTATHVPGDEAWAKVKDGTWERSIAGRFVYEE